MAAAVELLVPMFFAGELLTAVIMLTATTCPESGRISWMLSAIRVSVSGLSSCTEARTCCVLKLRFQHREPQRDVVRPERWYAGQSVYRVYVTKPSHHTSGFVSAGHRESLIFAVFKVLIAPSRLPLSLKSRRGHRFCRGQIYRMFDLEIYWRLLFVIAK